MIVHAFEETLDKGLQKDGEIVPMSEFVCDRSTGLVTDLGGSGSGMSRVEG